MFEPAECLLALCLHPSAVGQPGVLLLLRSGNCFENPHNAGKSWGIRKPLVPQGNLLGGSFYREHLPVVLFPSSGLADQVCQVAGAFRKVPL